MIEITRQVTGMAKKIDQISDVVDLLAWAHETPEVSCTVVARIDGSYAIELGGTLVDSVVTTVGYWVVFTGEQFYVLTDEEFEAKGFNTSQ